MWEVSKVSSTLSEGSGTSLLIRPLQGSAEWLLIPRLPTTSNTISKISEIPNSVTHYLIYLCNLTFGFRHIGPRTVGPRTVRGPTVQAPICREPTIMMMMMMMMMRMGRLYRLWGLGLACSPNYPINIPQPLRAERPFVLYCTIDDHHHDENVDYMTMQ